MKDVLWFKHDMNARNDVRVVKLRAKCGWEGYAFYFAVIEMMGETHGYKIEDDGELPETIACLLGIDIDKAKKFLEASVSTGLFKIEDGFLISESFLRRMSDYMEKSRKLRENGRKGGEAKAKAKQTPSNIVAIAKQIPSNCQANALADKIRLDKKREEDIREEKSKHFVPPTIEQIKAYCLERNNSVSPEKFLNYYESKGWLVGKAKMKCWRAAIRTWEGNGYDTPKVAKGHAEAPIQGKYDNIGEKI